MKFLIYSLLLLSLLLLSLIGCENNGKPKTRVYRTAIYGIYYICDNYHTIRGVVKLSNCKEEVSEYVDVDPNPVQINILNATDVFEVEL